LPRIDREAVSGDAWRSVAVPERARIKAYLTVCDNDAELPRKFAVPENVAVMTVVPFGSVAVDTRAMPFELTLTVPMIPVPVENVTEPAGAPIGVETVAVNVTVRPAETGFEDEVSAVLVGAGVTACVTGAEALTAELPSPP
jgi:hypothetical protein